MDTIGYGDSDKPARACSIEDYARGAAGFLDALGIARASVVGHHTGAVIAIELAASHPERVERLVLSARRDDRHMARCRMAKFETVPLSELKTRLLAELVPVVEEYNEKLEKLSGDQGGKLLLEAERTAEEGDRLTSSRVQSEKRARRQAVVSGWPE